MFTYSLAVLTHVHQVSLGARVVLLQRLHLSELMLHRVRTLLLTEGRAAALPGPLGGGGWAGHSAASGGNRRNAVCFTVSTDILPSVQPRPLSSSEPNRAREVVCCQSCCPSAHFLCYNGRGISLARQGEPLTFGAPMVAEFPRCAAQGCLLFLLIVVPSFPAPPPPGGPLLTPLQLL